MSELLILLLVVAITAGIWILIRRLVARGRSGM